VLDLRRIKLSKIFLSLIDLLVPKFFGFLPSSCLSVSQKKIIMRNIDKRILFFLLPLICPGLMLAQCTATTVPYYEDFQSISASNQFPACWASSSPSVNCVTFSTTNSYAAFFFNPTGTHYFYSRGVQLYAGYTYSVSMWYKTDNTGGQNWSNLVLSYGSSQTPTGQVNITSVTGVVASPSYVLLSGTFVAPTTSVYYIAVRATGSNTGTSQYLNWDDFSVTCPCNLGANTPTPGLVIPPSSNTICLGKSAQLNALCSGPVTYSWTTGGTGPTETVTPPATGITTYSAFITNTLTNCVLMMPFIFLVNPKPNVLIIPVSATVCAGKPTSISAYGASNYAWSNGGSSSSITVTLNGSTSYTVIGMNSFGCLSTATASVFVNSDPTITIVASPASVCQGEPVQLTATGAANYTWTILSNIYQGSVITLTPSSAGLFTITGEGVNGCFSTASQFITVSPCVGLSSVSGQEELKFFPNPSGEFITVKNNGKGGLWIFDINGAEVMKAEIAGQEQKINISTLSPGVYYLEISDRIAKRTTLLIKQ
jgi:hypothetical protein